MAAGFEQGPDDPEDDLTRVDDDDLHGGTGFEAVTLCEKP